MRKNIIFLVFALASCCICQSLYAQNSIKPNEPSPRNAVMLEVGGHGVFYSLNYERILVNNLKTKTTFQIGVAHYGKNADMSPFWVPMTLNQLFRTAKRQFVEVGGGMLLRDVGNGNDHNVPARKYKMKEFVFRLGYRLHSKNQKWVYRAAYTPLFLDSDDFIHWGAVSIGRRF